MIRMCDFLGVCVGSDDDDDDDSVAQVRELSRLKPQQDQTVFVACWKFPQESQLSTKRSLYTLECDLLSLLCNYDTQQSHKAVHVYCVRLAVINTR